MATPPDAQEGQSTTMPPLFNEKYYGWWIWDIIQKSPKVPMEKDDNGEVIDPKIREHL